MKWHDYDIKKIAVKKARYSFSFWAFTPRGRLISKKAHFAICRLIYNIKHKLWHFVTEHVQVNHNAGAEPQVLSLTHFCLLFKNLSGKLTAKFLVEKLRRIEFGWPYHSCVKQRQTSVGGREVRLRPRGSDSQLDIPGGGGGGAGTPTGHRMMYGRRPGSSGKLKTARLLICKWKTNQVLSNLLHWQTGS